MFDIIVIGSGMAGMTSAIYALREKKSVLVIEKESIGGQITQSPNVQNYPSFSQISGNELADKTFEQMSALGAEFEVENVEKIEKVGDRFVVKTDYASHEAKAVIIASGLKHRTLGLENEDRFVGKGVYYCAICDGPFYAGKEVSVIGGGNSGMQFAIMLANYCSKVNIFVSGNKFSGEKALEEKILQKKNIQAFYGCRSTKLNGKDSLESITFRKTDGTEFEHKTNAVFVAVGQIPNNKIFKNLVEIDERGFIVADDCCKTSCEGVFAAGDCRQKAVRQVATAVGDGATAGTFACKYIDMNAGNLWKS